jgi:hypothetical protein
LLPAAAPELFLSEFFPICDKGRNNVLPSYLWQFVAGKNGTNGRETRSRIRCAG